MVEEDALDLSDGLFWEDGPAVMAVGVSDGGAMSDSEGRRLEKGRAGWRGRGSRMWSRSTLLVPLPPPSQLARALTAHAAFSRGLSSETQGRRMSRLILYNRVGQQARTTGEGDGSGRGMRSVREAEWITYNENER